MKQFLKKLFGIKPTVGDRVCGGLDFGVSYRGVVVKTPTNDLFPCYEVEGQITIYTDWSGAVTEKKTFTVPESKICLE